MSERNYYVLCDDNCRFESMTKEQIIAAIAEATGTTPTDIDDAFITKIKESNHNANLTFWKGTEAEFNALSVTAAAYRVIVDANGKLYFLPSANNMSELSYEQGDDNAIQLKHNDNDVFPNIMSGQTEPVADCVVEQGTSGMWTYRKWASGIAECWGYKTVNCTIETQYGTATEVYTVGINADLPSDLFVSVNSASCGGGKFATGASFAVVTEWTTEHILIRLIDFYRRTEAQDVYINYSVKGRWK